MVESGRPDTGDGERLPWLEDEPAPAAKAAEPTAAAKPKGTSEKSAGNSMPDGFWYGVAGVTGLIAALGAGYLLGERHILSPDINPPSDIAIADVEESAPDEEIVAASAEIDEPEEEEQAEAEAVEEPAPQAAPARTTQRPRARPQRRSAPHLSGEERYQAKVAEAARTWPKMPAPGPAGQVIQLGAFSSKSKAETTYRRRATRYPLLATMPKVVVPVVTRPEGQVLYVLRLGTNSRNQSEIVCRNLQASGDHCLVIG